MTREERAIQALKAIVDRYDGEVDDLIVFIDLWKIASDMARIAKTTLRNLGELE